MANAEPGRLETCFGVRKLADNLAMVISLEGANPSGKGLVSHPYPNPEVD